MIYFILPVVCDHVLGKRYINTFLFVWLFPAQCVIRGDDMMMQHTPISSNIKTTRQITLIISLQSNVLWGNLGSWHSCRCHLTHTTHFHTSNTPTPPPPWEQHSPVACTPAGRCGLAFNLDPQQSYWQSNSITWELLLQIYPGCSYKVCPFEKEWIYLVV